MFTNTDRAMVSNRESMSGSICTLLSSFWRAFIGWYDKTVKRGMSCEAEQLKAGTYAGRDRRSIPAEVTSNIIYTLMECQVLWIKATNGIIFVLNENPQGHKSISSTLEAGCVYTLAKFAQFYFVLCT